MRHIRLHIQQRRTLISVAAVSVVALGLAACSAPADGGDGGAEKTLQVAYLSFAVANTYDTPMLAAAQAVADANNVELTVFDANNDPTAQAAQFQDAIASGQYDGIITQPIYGPALLDATAAAIAAGIKVVNIDQILGSDFTTGDVQVDGLSANVSQRPSDMGTKLGQQTVAACASQALDPCKVAYIYDIKASALDVAIRDAWDAAVAGSPVKVIAEGESFFNPANALTVVQDMLTANTDLQLIVGSDQGLQGADQAIEAAGKTGKLLLVGFGGSEVGISAVADGRWFADVMMVPASEGRLGMEAMVDALRNGNDQGAVDPFADLPNEGVVTAETASEFTGEWPG
ncbi:substrate-binding domain-containing protein [soil metagenome]